MARRKCDGKVTFVTLFSSLMLIIKQQMTMKKLFINAFASLALLAASGNAFAQSSFTINGTVEQGGEGKYIYLLTGSRISDDMTADSAMIKNGKFTFKGSTNMNVDSRILTAEFPINMRTRNAKSFYIEPTTMQLTVKSLDNLKDSKLTGSESQASVDDYNEYMADIMEPLEKLNDLYYKTRDNGDTATFKRVSREMNELRDKYISKQNTWLKEHSDSYMALDQQSIMVRDMKPEQVQAFYNSIPEKYRNSPAGNSVAEELAKLNKCAPGAVAMDFTSTDINGKQFTLSSLKGHYIILDFWASWCKPCRASMPHVKALYEKYKAKGLEVVCVASDDGAEDKWRKAVAEDQTELFHHVLSGLKRTANGGYDKSQSISDNYGVHYLPTKYLVDAEGKIVDKVDDEKLEELLKTAYGF